MTMYPPAYTWTHSYPHHVTPSDHMKIPQNQMYHQQHQQQQPWDYNYYYNHPYNPHACCNHPYYLPPPHFYPPHHGFYSPFPFPPQPYHYYSNNHNSCCHQDDVIRPKIKQEYSQVGDHTKLPANDHSFHVDDPVSPFQIFWLPSKNNDLENENHTSNNNLEQVADTSNKQAVKKVVPVKQLVTNEEKNKTTEVLTANSEKKTDRVSPKASSSKLPPVCLRIDPLPKDKKSSSHSPKSSQQQAHALNKNREEQNEGDINKAEQDSIGDNMPRVKEAAAAAASEKEKKKVSENEAALIIQSLYRGFQVRKSQPMKKLRQIYEVKNLVSELRNRIQNLESSSSNIKVDGKEKLMIGESIMSLLLKLDTIQGLHPYVREVRKSVAKELVGLQEKLDSLTFIESETPSDELHKEKINDAMTKCEVEATKLQEGCCNTTGEPELESHDHNANEGHEVEGGENNGEEEVVANSMKHEHEVHVDNSSIRKTEADNNDAETMIMVEEMKSPAKDNKENEKERYEEVIRELTRRVKDLEKKLISKKKKIKVNKCNRRRKST